MKPIAIFLLLLTASCADATTDVPAPVSNIESPDSFNDTEARVKVWYAVKAKLVSPSTAEFGPVGFEPDGPDRWAAESYVDSQNALGGSLRTYFRATVNGDGDVVDLHLE